MTIVEVGETSISVNGKMVNDLGKALEELDKLEQIHLMVDKELAHKRVVEVMEVATSLKFENITIQSH